VALSAINQIKEEIDAFAAWMENVLCTNRPQAYSQLQTMPLDINMKQLNIAICRLLGQKTIWLIWSTVRHCISKLPGGTYRLQAPSQWRFETELNYLHSDLQYQSKVWTHLLIQGVFYGIM
jgi:hypothetical protein